MCVQTLCLCAHVHDKTLTPISVKHLSDGRGKTKTKNSRRRRRPLPKKTTQSRKNNSNQTPKQTNSSPPPPPSSKGRRNRKSQAPDGDGTATVLEKTIPPLVVAPLKKKLSFKKPSAFLSEMIESLIKTEFKKLIQKGKK